MATNIFYSNSTNSRTGNPQKGEYIARNIYIHYNAKSNTSGRIYVLRVRSRSNLAPNQDESVAWDRTSISRIASQHLQPDYLIRRPDSAMRSLSSVTQSILMAKTNSVIDHKRKDTFAKPDKLYGISDSFKSNQFITTYFFNISNFLTSLMLFN